MLEQDKVLQNSVSPMPCFTHMFQPGAVLQVTGEDAADYLQSQCSADLAPARDNLAVYGLWLNRKGKVEGDGFILRRSDEDFLIVSYHCSSGALAEKIIANVVADEVEIKDQTIATSGLSLWGDATPEILTEIDLPWPESSSWTSQGEIIIFNGRRSRDIGFDLVGPKGKIDSLADEVRQLIVDQGGRELNANEVHFARIEAGIPAIPDEIGPNDLPQEGSLEKNSVSFDKGCFLGQEVMSRLRSMGSVKRKLWAVELLEKGVSTPWNLFLDGKLVGTLKTHYSNEDKEMGVAMLMVNEIKKVQLSGIATESHKSPSVVLLHEFIS